MLEPIRVSFKCRAYTLSAHLYTPPAGSPQRAGAAVVIPPPWTGVKEQAPANYARLLATAGFVCLAFDAAFQGESTGEPRYLEDPAQRVEDIKAAVSYLTTRDDLVDPRRIGVLGICVAGGYACFAAQTDVRIRATATVSAVCVGQMSRKGLEQDVGNGSMTVLQARLEIASRDRNTEARNNAILSDESSSSSSAAAGKQIGVMQVFPHSYDPARPPPGMSVSFQDLSSYYRTDRGKHPRAPSVCIPRSWDLMANFNAFQYNKLIGPRPLLMIIGSRAATGKFSEDAVAKASKDRSELFVVEGRTHADLFDHVDEAGARLVDYFARMLGPLMRSVRDQPDGSGGSGGSRNS